MEKAIRVLDGVIKGLESEVRIWTKQGDIKTASICKEEIDICKKAIERLSTPEIISKTKVYDIETGTVHDFVRFSDDGNRVVMHNKKYGSTSNTLDKIRFIQF